MGNCEKSWHLEKFYKIQRHDLLMGRGPAEQRLLQFIDVRKVKTCRELRHGKTEVLEHRELALGRR